MLVGWDLQGSSEGLSELDGGVAFVGFDFFDHGGGAVNGRCHFPLRQFQLLASLFEPFANGVGVCHLIILFCTFLLDI
jgi:hypothetical protein